MFLRYVILPDMCVCMYVEYASIEGSATAAAATCLCRYACRQHVVLNIGFCITDIGIQ
jgi:hypothetical protein